MPESRPLPSTDLYEVWLSHVRWFAAAGALLVGLAVNLWCQIGLFLTQPGWSLGKFRWYYSYDQLSYLAIVQNIAHRNWAPVEPFTETGTNHYPRAYYQLLGLVSDLTGVSPVMTWNVVAAAFQAGLVVVIAVTTVLLTRHWWTAVLAPLPLLAGTFSWYLAGDWKQTLDSHAVLWGPFGVLFTANGESASLCVAISALLIVVLVAAGRIPMRARLAVGTAACTAIGILAAVQTYTFLSATYVLLYGAAIYGLMVARRRWAIWASGVILVAALAAGPVVADAVSPLAALILGATPTLPGLWVLCVRLRWRPLWGLGGLMVAALPQTLGTVLAVSQGNEFLVYREASSKDLGIPLLDGLRAAALPLVLLLAVVVLAVLRRRLVAAAAGMGILVPWVLLATNDKWGANQEPYRFWIDVFAIGCVVGMVLLAWLVARPAESSTLDSSDEAPAALDEPAGVRRIGQVAVAIVAVLFVVSLTDYTAFRREVSGWQPLDFATTNAHALAKAADASGNGIVLPDPCIDPFILKTAWGGQIAFYNLGLAWPEKHEALQKVLDQRAEKTVNVDDLEAASIGWVLTDSSCASGWGARLSERGLGPVIEVPVDGSEARYSLWRVPGNQ